MITSQINIQGKDSKYLKIGKCLQTLLMYSLAIIIAEQIVRKFALISIGYTHKK